MKVAAAMSGGVDSSVAAALAVRAGHDVVGVTLKQWEFPDEELRLAKGCCTLDAVADARRAADIVGIPHYTLDFREVFEREVIDPFVGEYSKGLTPNPCIRCNERVRFGALWERVQMLGFDGLVTGHYARVDGSRLFRARNGDKDQSYVLYAIDPDVLDRVRFPLGEFETKRDVRGVAEELGLPNAAREDSVEVCFVGEGRKPGDVVRERATIAVRPGPILDATGTRIGRHKGLPYYTVGQRRGLGALGTTPRYVTAIDAERNVLVVAERDALAATGLETERARYLSGSAPRDGSRFHAVVRYRGRPVLASFESTADGFRLAFDEPVEAVAPGQSVVLYDGDEVVGGGTITTALR